MFPFLPQNASAAADALVDAGAAADLLPGAQTTVFVGFNRVLVLRTEDAQLYAMADLCPHALQPLAGGVVRDGSIVCAKHQACFDLKTGKPLNRLTNKPLSRYEVSEHEGRIKVGRLVVDPR